MMALMVGGWLDIVNACLEGELSTRMMNDGSFNQREVYLLCIIDHAFAIKVLQAGSPPPHTRILRNTSCPCQQTQLSLSVPIS